ncbi:MAG TPA: DUF2062 domain-containing protein [Kaistella chaponensis]|uniref:DUF2062 domain-containing protein n=1 Tax=Kaistella chaponensis TaxID=713588 RepID=UPI002BDADDA7|nr:DUF2062 domain-containing protein [Kaistella chaponensis]HPW87623.1 DUF2062 domain-containing protein [Kaistella chaponensis]HQC06570.1 DUF2062 domain-containing protein [Kaistella chaponensis]
MTKKRTDLHNFIQNTIQSQKVFYRYFRKKGFKRFFKENILDSEGSNEIKAKSIALGVFVGLTPLWGFHTVVILFLASVLKLNKLLSYMGTHVSFPLFIPFIIFLSMVVGGPFVDEQAQFTYETLDLEFAKSHLLQYVIGSSILAASSSLVIGFSTYFILENFKPSRSK